MDAMLPLRAVRSWRSTPVALLEAMSAEESLDSDPRPVGEPKREPSLSEIARQTWIARADANDIAVEKG